MSVSLAVSCGTCREALHAMIDIYLEMAEASPNVYWFVTRPVSEEASAPLGHFLDAVAELIARPFARAVAAAERGARAYLWPAGDVDWYKVIFLDTSDDVSLCDKFDARVNFTATGKSVDRRKARV